MLQRPDVFSAGFVIAPGVEWTDYDTAYTERYLGLSQDNAAAYEEESILHFASAPLPPRVHEPALLIAHGTADDNVYFLNSLRLTDALALNGRHFVFLPFRGETHMFATPAVRQSIWLSGADMLRTAFGAH